MHRPRVGNARDAHASDVGAAAFRRVDDGVGQRLVQLRHQTAAQSLGVAVILVEMLLCKLNGRGHARRQKHGLGARAQAALLVSAKRGGEHVDAAPHVQDADAARAADLVGAGGEQLAAQVVHVDRQLAERLRGVGVQQRLGCQLVADARNFRDGENPARLVLHAHHSDERGGRGAQVVAQLVEVEFAVRRFHVTAGPGVVATHAAHAARDRCVLERRRDDLPRLVAARQARAAHRQVVRLGGARREVDLVGMGAERVGDDGAAFLEHVGGAAARHMRRGRVSPGGRHHLVHALDNLGQGFCGGGVIQIRQSLFHALLAPIPIRAPFPPRAIRLRFAPILPCAPQCC